ncbi:hypothetical protein OVX87_16480 [Klebsiella pneumoniae]|nr:hypothetical protein [Klebsiella pneumoniae]
MIDGLYDGHIASNKLRMTYCKTAPSLFSVSNSGKEFVRAALAGHFNSFSGHAATCAFSGGS